MIVEAFRWGLHRHARGTRGQVAQVERSIVGHDAIASHYGRFAIRPLATRGTPDSVKTTGRPALPEQKSSGRWSSEPWGHRWSCHRPRRQGRRSRYRAPSRQQIAFGRCTTLPLHDSTGQCNGVSEYIRRRSRTECLAWPRVERARDLVWLGLTRTGRIWMEGSNAPARRRFRPTFRWRTFDSGATNRARRAPPFNSSIRSRDGQRWTCRRDEAMPRRPQNERMIPPLAPANRVFTTLL